MPPVFDDAAPSVVALSVAALRSIYAAAFTSPPWRETPGQVEAFAAGLPSQTGKPGFHCVTAHVDGEPAGSGYGFDSPDPWPADRLYRPVADAPGGDTPVLGNRFADEPRWSWSSGRSGSATPPPSGTPAMTPNSRSG